MNEMKLLEEFRGAVAPPDQGTLAEARARVLGSAGSPGRCGRRAQGLRRLAAWPRIASLGAAAAVTAVAVAAAVALPSGGPPAPRRTGTTLTAATVLHRAARAALSAPVPHGNQYLYTDTEYVDPSGSPRVYTAELWLSVDGSRQILGFPCSLKHPRKCANYVMFRVSPDRHVFTYAGLEKLPTAPGALLSYLYREQARACPKAGIPVTDRPAMEWSGISTILGDVPVLPPRFGAALFEAAARIPGVKVIMNIRDAAGERGIAVARALPEGRGPDRGYPESSAFIFRPRTYQFIGTAIAYPGGTALTGLRASKFVQTAPTHWANRRPLVPPAQETCALHG